MSDRKRWSSVDAEQANALASLIEAGNSGDGAAACRIGDIYREEVVGLDGSSKMAFHWYSRSALAGDANGQNNLGACYEHGLGCSQSYPKAVKWYRLAAAQGLGTAAMNLGYCCLHGHGVPRDKFAALKLFRLAVECGENRAAKEVERLEGDRTRRVLQLAPSDTGPSTDSGDCSTSLAGTQIRSLPRVPKLGPTDTLRVRPWKLAGGSLPPDGPWAQLRHSENFGTERGDGLQRRLQRPDAAQSQLRDGPPGQLQHSSPAEDSEACRSTCMDARGTDQPAGLSGAREGRDDQRSDGKD